MTFDEIKDNFALLDDWDDRYRYIIELGKDLPSLAESDRTAVNKVQGCVSQVWLATTVHRKDAGNPVLTFVGDSDAHIVRGLIAIMLSVISGKTARDILATDPLAYFEALDLKAHLTPQRSNGLAAMVKRVQRDARAALDAV